MRQATGTARARAALLGNPSDGFGGKTIAVSIRDFAAEVVVREAEGLEIVPADEDRNRFRDLDDLVGDVVANGYYGGLRLVKAAIKRFADHCREVGAPPGAGFSVSYRTTIPRQVGLGGSSAIVIATLRALARYHGVAIEPARLAKLALATETEELGIPAGLQDRVVQAYEGLVYMDFDPAATDPYERLDPAMLPPLFLAYRGDASEPSAAVHAELRTRFRRGDRDVVDAMSEIARLAELGRDRLLAADADGLAELMARNVAARARMISLDPRHARMVEIAAAAGAAANYAGSGGAIVGIVPPSGIEPVRAALVAEGCEVIAPTLAPVPAATD